MIITAAEMMHATSTSLLCRLQITVARTAQVDMNVQGKLLEIDGNSFWQKELQLQTFQK